MDRENGRRGNGAALVGAGAGAMLVALLVLQSFASTGLFAVKTETSTVTASLDRQEATIVGQAFANHVKDFASLDAPAFSDQYAHNATITWTGDINTCCTPQTSQMTPGEVEVPLERGLALGLVGTLEVSAVEENISALSGGSALVNATFDFKGTSSYLGQVNGTVTADEAYVYSAPLYGSTFGGWLIAQESWTVLTPGLEPPPFAAG
ncbi:MAG: hypothetical protein JRM86_00810 [Nitrososphaerota archaeon]|nr:hypothetical protein [Nitrososphaerota archaeon]